MILPICILELSLGMITLATTTTKKKGGGLNWPFWRRKTSQFLIASLHWRMMEILHFFIMLQKNVSLSVVARSNKPLWLKVILKPISVFTTFSMHMCSTHQRGDHIKNRVIAQYAYIICMTNSKSTIKHLTLDTGTARSKHDVSSILIIFIRGLEDNWRTLGCLGIRHLKEGTNSLTSSARQQD